MIAFNHGRIQAIARGSGFFNVYPRYTPGSPALVRRDIADRLIRSEQAVYDDMIKGLYGPAKKAEAARLGLRSIVEETWEFRGVLMYRDAITGETGGKIKCEHCGHRHAVGKNNVDAYEPHPDEERHHPDTDTDYWAPKGC
jgi:hypothetical protein